MKIGNIEYFNETVDVLQTSPENFVQNEQISNPWFNK